VLLPIGKTHGKSAAQVMLRWHLQQGRSAIPKSVKSTRIAENFDIFDFELSNEELAAIDALDAGERLRQPRGTHRGGLASRLRLDTS
jgi:2,5-diketo-D-gluconate reductase A